MINEYSDRREIDNIYDKVKKNIKEQIELKGVSCKGSTKGTALSEIMSVFDDELGLGIAKEMIDGRKIIRQYYSKYSDVSDLERQYRENEKKLKEQQKVADLVSLLTDEVLKNAIIAYNAVKDTSRDMHNAKDIAIAYINSKGREDLQGVIAPEEYVPMSAITMFKEKVAALKGDNFRNDYYVQILEECIKECK